MKSDIIITIDGPSGAGKSTLARDLANKLGWSFLDTGAIYRAVAFAAMEKALSLDDPAALGTFVRSLDVKVELAADKSRVFLGKRELTDLIRGEEVSKAASKISSHKDVRLALLDLQLRIGEKGKLVTEGRDQGTAVFPWARLKFYLTASVEERAKRRHKELMEKSENVTYKEVLEKMIERDTADETRETFPLRPADGAIVIDATLLTQAEALLAMAVKAWDVFPDIFAL
jgi:cytidylate kinase